MQDEHTALPENVTEDIPGFLLEWFQKHSISGQT